MAELASDLPVRMKKNESLISMQNIFKPKSTDEPLDSSKDILPSSENLELSNYSEQNIEFITFSGKSRSSFVEAT